MNNKGLIIPGILLCFSVTIMIFSCGSGGAGTPKEAVIKLFGGMERNDRAAILHVIDISQLMGKKLEDYALQTDKPRTFYNPEDMLNDLTGEGLTKTRWFSMQRIVGQTLMSGDSATVEVSFINKKTDIQYYTRFGLHKKNNGWKIYSFKAIDDN